MTLWRRRKSEPRPPWSFKQKPRVKTIDGETEILRKKMDREVMVGLWEVKTLTLKSNDEVSESLMLALGSWAGSGGKGAPLVIPH